MTTRESWDFIAGLEFYRALEHLEFPVPKQDQIRAKEWFL
jgi:hypothetical protein